MATGVFVDAAQAGRLSYVSSTGNDANACTLAAPCRTLTHAIAVTTLGGEVRLIDSAGYGASIAIGKSITLSGNGATIFAGRITINGASAVVTLRDLTLNGGGTPSGSTGVTIQAAKAVHIEHCTIHGFPAQGVSIESNVDVFVSDSTVRDNAGEGLFVSGGTAGRLTVANSHFDSNVGGGLLIQGGEAVIDRALVSGNGVGFAGITVGDGSNVTLESSVMRGNGAGLLAFNASTVRISNSVVTQNSGSGISNSGATVLTRQNNTVSGNGTDVFGTLTPLGGV
jgi:hypothetical protein